VTGAWVLHLLTRNLDLDFLMFFSTAASIWGSKGLASYAAANQFLDALAHYRQSQGLPGLSINWARLGTDSCELETFFAQIGLEVMDTSAALDVMGQILGTGASQKIVAAVDWSTFKPVYEAKRRRPFLDGIGLVPESTQEPRTREKTGIHDRLEKAHPKEHVDLLIEHLRYVVASVLGFDSPELVDPQQGLFEMGVDSLMTVELRTQLETDLKRTVSSTLLFDHPSVQAIAEHLASSSLQAEILDAVDVKLQGDGRTERDLLEDLERLSEEEADALLSDQIRGVSEGNA
jgi:myxalamid-type polyketide synthase MxaE and MxaD